MNCKSAIEVLPWEAGKSWVVSKDFTVWNCTHTKSLTVRKGFRSDYYSVVPNLPDPVPAISHDDAYTIQLWDDGTPITENEANVLLLWLMQSSWSWWTRLMASPYYWGVCRWGHFFWLNKQAIKCRVVK